MKIKEEKDGKNKNKGEHKRVNEAGKQGSERRRQRE